MSYKSVAVWGGNEARAASIGFFGIVLLWIISFSEGNI